MLDFNFQESVQRIAKAFARDSIYTALPAVITSTENYETRQVVDISVTIDRLYEDGKSLPAQSVFEVPVHMLGGGGAWLTMPVAKDDVVLAIFSQRDIDKWASSDGKTSNIPNTSRSHNITDAFVITGFGTDKNNATPNPDHVELKFAGSSYQFKNNGDIEGQVAGDANLTVTGTTTINSNGNLNLNSAGDINIAAVGAVNITGSTVNLN
jgi:hypothetical protein